MEIIEKEKVKEVPADYFCDKYSLMGKEQSRCWSIRWVISSCKCKYQRS